MSKWEKVKLGDVCDIERGGSPRPIDKFITNDPSGINWIKIGDTSPESMYITKTKQKITPEGAKKSRYVKPGDFLLSNSMSFGRPYILKIDGCIHDGWLVLRDKNDYFHKEYLYYALSSKSTYEKFKNLAIGGVVNNLNTNLVKQVEIPLPPFEIQKQIAKNLNTVAELLALRKQQLDELDNLTKSIFCKMFNSYFYDSSCFEILPDVCNFIDYRGKTPEKSDSGIPLITAKNVKNNAFSLEPREYISNEVYKKVMKRGFPKINDVLFTTEAPLGNVCRIPNIFEKFAVGQRIIVMQPFEDKVTSEYLEFVLSSGEIQREIYKHSSGSTVRGIRSKELAKISIPVPPLELQNQFADIVTKIEEQKALVKKAIDETQTLFDSLMSQYFD